VVSEEEGATEVEKGEPVPHSATKSRGVLHKALRYAQLDFGPMHDRGDKCPGVVVGEELSFDNCSSLGASCAVVNSTACSWRIVAGPEFESRVPSADS
jgi:hypothetical protein